MPGTTVVFFHNLSRACPLPIIALALAACSHTSKMKLVSGCPGLSGTVRVGRDSNGNFVSTVRAVRHNQVSGPAAGRYLVWMTIAANGTTCAGELGFVSRSARTSAALLKVVSVYRPSGFSVTAVTDTATPAPQGASATLIH